MIHCPGPENNVKSSISRWVLLQIRQGQPLTFTGETSDLLTDRAVSPHLLTQSCYATHSQPHYPAYQAMVEES